MFQAAVSMRWKMTPRSNWKTEMLDSYGYGSIPMKIPFLGGWTSIYQLFWCELQGYKVLTHCHIFLYSLKCGDQMFAWGLDLQDMAATCWKYTCITWSHAKTCQQNSMFGGTATTHFFEVQTMLGWSQSVYDEIGGTGSRQCWWLFQMLAVAVADSWTPPVLCLPVTRKATEYFDTGEGAIKLRRAHLENATPALILVDLLAPINSVKKYYSNW